MNYDELKIQDIIKFTSNNNITKSITHLNCIFFTRPFKDGARLCWYLVPVLIDGLIQV